MTDQGAVTYNGRYEVQRRIARGGMAEVFLARDLLLARPVAVKVLFAEFATDPAFVARFRREAQAAANLNHPNIVGVYDWGQEGSTYYIVMEYVDGRSLSDILRTEGLPPADAAAGIASDVAAALGSAHRNGVVHRDIKPGNIMITLAGHVKVADFGIARAIAGGEDNLTQTGSVMGTATYFSPEQAQGHPVDPRSDLYSLGVVMYEMATGRAPFTGDSPVAIAYKHVQETPANLRQSNPTVPEAYEAITLKLLAKAPDDRYATAEDLRGDLRRFLDGRAVKAEQRPVSPSPALTAPVAPSRPLPPPVYPDESGRRRTGWFIAVLLLLLVALGALLFAFAQTLGITGEDKVTVPTVIGQNGFAAIGRLRDAGLEVVAGDIRMIPSDTVEKGMVISQDPVAGTEVAKGTSISLTTSTGPPGPEKKDLPRVEGQSEEAARTALATAGFTNIGPSDVRNDPSVGEGSVISQSPDPGLQPVDVRITLVISDGPEATTTGSTAPPSTAPETTASTTTTTTTPPSTTASTTASTAPDSPSSSEPPPSSEP